MKITKRQLRRIIKEEKRKLVREQSAHGPLKDGTMAVIQDVLLDVLHEHFETLHPAALEEIAAATTGHDFDEITQKLAKIALGNIGSDHSHYRGS